ncbi:MAG TPA: hypothetical protein VIK69_00830 [Methylophilaceae bacterium]|jgi:hypothetical protein
MRITVILTLLALTCACSVLDNKTTDSRQWTRVACIGFSDWQVCHDEAHKLCPGGYDTRNQQENLVTQNRSMEVACRN